MNVVELLKVIFLGIVEGITEWLPISSTGHMILVDEVIAINASDAFMEMFFVVIQLGAIMAVVVLYFNKLLPFDLKNKLAPKKDIWILWFKIIIACIPAAVIGLMYEDVIDKVFLSSSFRTAVVAGTLIFYGIVFIVIERTFKGKSPKVNKLEDLTFLTAFGIGLFQLLALVPGTSRSGATIIGAMLIGTSRTVAAEFTFFLAIPVMFGASLIKMIGFGLIFTSAELIILIVGMLVAFLVSILAIKFLVGYIKKHDFQVFGYYRIVLGILVFILYALK